MTKHSSADAASSPSSAHGRAALLDHFATHGWVCFRAFLSPPELRFLQRESHSLYANAHADPAQAAAAVVGQGCVLDVLAQCPMRDADPARVNMDRYLAARAKQMTSATGCKTETSSAADALQDDVLVQLLFERLPTVAAELLATTGASETCFFNEHYVVKPPQSHVEFRWHRDDDEQLGMCLHRDALPPYVSAWCALDDVTAVNGALQFVSLAASDAEDESVESLQRRASLPLNTQAGDVLFFLSSVWHCSASNESDAPRRAFYAQYSSGRITAGPNDPAPLSFAIPCVSTSASASLEACKDGSTALKKRKIDASGS